jgi:hypothetical protein
LNLESRAVMAWLITFNLKKPSVVGLGSGMLGRVYCSDLMCKPPYFYISLKCLYGCIQPIKWLRYIMLRVTLRLDGVLLVDPVLQSEGVTTPERGTLLGGIYGQATQFFSFLSHRESCSFIFKL